MATYTMPAASSVAAAPLPWDPMATPAASVAVPPMATYTMPATSAYSSMPTSYSYPSAPSMYMPSAYSPYGAAPVDHSQGKWFAPGEALPAGFVAATHPAGALQPQAGHALSDGASFVITSGTTGAAPAAETAAPATRSLGDATKATKKKSSKKKSSGCC